MGKFAAYLNLALAVAWLALFFTNDALFVSHETDLSDHLRGDAFAMTTAAWVGQNHAAAAGMQAVAASGRRYRSILMFWSSVERDCGRRDSVGEMVRRRDVLYAQVALRRRADHADTPARPRGPLLELRRHEREPDPDL